MKIEKKTDQSMFDPLRIPMDDDQEKQSKNCLGPEEPLVVLREPIMLKSLNLNFIINTDVRWGNHNIILSLAIIERIARCCNERFLGPCPSCYWIRKGKSINQFKMII